MTLIQMTKNERLNP